MSEGDEEVGGVWIVGNVVELEGRGGRHRLAMADPSTGQMQINAVNCFKFVKVDATV